MDSTQRLGLAEHVNVLSLQKRSVDASIGVYNRFVVNHGVEPLVDGANKDVEIVNETYPKIGLSCCYWHSSAGPWIKALEQGEQKLAWSLVSHLQVLDVVASNSIQAPHQIRNDVVR